MKKLALLALLLAGTAPAFGAETVKTEIAPTFTRNIVIDPGTAFTHIESLGLREFDPNAVGGGPRPPPIPEPASWAMLIVGFGALGLEMRRRRRVAAS